MIDRKQKIPGKRLHVKKKGGSQKLLVVIQRYSEEESNYRGIEMNDNKKRRQRVGKGSSNFNNETN